MSACAEQPLVSIFTPAYNAEKFIKRAIDSVMSQTYRCFEYYITDDGSTDNTDAIILQCLDDYPEAESYVHYIPHSVNTGFAWHEEILPLMKGKYICGLAGDDAMKPDRVEKQVAFLESNGAKYAGCFTWVEVSSDDPGSIESFEHLFNIENESCDDYLRRLLAGHNFLNAPSMMFNLDVYKRLGGYNFKYRQSQDYALWLKALLSSYKFAIMPEKLTIYSVHENSMSSPKDLVAQLLFCKERDDILLEAYSEISDDMFFSLFKDELEILFPELDLNKGLTKYDYMCLKILYLFCFQLDGRFQVACSLYYRYADIPEFNSLLADKYGFTRCNIHNLIKDGIAQRKLNQYSSTPDYSKLTTDLMDILDGNGRQVTKDHIAALYETCQKIEDGQNMFRNVINALDDAGISYW